MADCTALKTRLDQLISARDRLLTGRQIVVVVDANRSRVEYTPANSNSLYAEIAKLQAQYDACIGGVPTVLTRPFQYFF